jgi:hypothetical protein
MSSLCVSLASQAKSRARLDLTRDSMLEIMPNCEEVGFQNELVIVQFG